MAFNHAAELVTTVWKLVLVMLLKVHPFVMLVYRGLPY